MKRFRRRGPGTARMIEANKLKIQQLKASTPCADCGYTFPPEAMDFDHRAGTYKSGAVSQMVNSIPAWKAIEHEIRKCDLVCANCHRSRTKARAGGIPIQGEDCEPELGELRWPDRGVEVNRRESDPSIGYMHARRHMERAGVVIRPRRSNYNVFPHRRTRNHESKQPKLDS